MTSPNASQIHQRPAAPPPSGMARERRSRPAAQSCRAAEKAVFVCDSVTDITAALFNVSGRELRQPGRTTTGVTRVRQIAMYVAHVVMSLSMTEVGRGFARDRTTVVHACHLVEDMRDDPDFDAIVALTERVVGAALRGREHR